MRDFETDAPETVEITVFRGRNYRLLHLVNFTYALRRPFNRVFPVENVSFKIRSERALVERHGFLRQDGLRNQEEPACF
ncbi:MAG: hypothetical protein QXY99_05355 [Thermoproteota archaeon]